MGDIVEMAEKGVWRTSEKSERAEGVVAITPENQVPSKLLFKAELATHRSHEVWHMWTRV